MSLNHIRELQRERVGALTLLLQIGSAGDPLLMAVQLRAIANMPDDGMQRKTLTGGKSHGVTKEAARRLARRNLASGL
ncbi:MAG: hypothetical protein BWY63_02731 [Chloroflexi bacterium ADurb.Bin360]|nr:MAG: hypothetical protein BWY63_02731 [Chloroflexi bacterium ADurb.Bin360]